jgi:hypothetical protein
MKEIRDDLIALVKKVQVEQMLLPADNPNVGLDEKFHKLKSDILQELKPSLYSFVIILNDFLREYEKFKSKER